MMARSANAGILAIFCVSLVCATAHAQLREGDPLRFSIKIGAEYTDNRDSQAVGQDSTDIWTSPRLDAVVDWERGALDMYYEPAFRYRTEPSDVQNHTELQHDLSVVLNHELHPRFSVDAKERFARTDDPSIQRDGATLRRDSSYIINWAGLGAKYSFRPRTSLALNADHNLKRYDESEVADESDESRMHGNLVLWHQVARTVGLLGTVDANMVDYKHPDGIDRDYVGTYGGLGVDKIFTQGVRGSARAGYSSLEYDAKDIPSDTAPYFNVDVTIEPMPTRRFVAGGSYELREAYAYPHASQKYTGAYGRMELGLTARLMLKLGLEYRIGKYDLDTVPDEALDRVMANRASYPDWVRHFLDEGKTSGDDKTLVTSLELAFEIDKSTSVALVHRYEDVSSDVGISFDRNSAGLVLARNF